jgi:uncharacterized cupin superfamily protein
VKKVNLLDIPEQSERSPKGKFVAFFKEISVALGREPKSTDLLKRHPFDLALFRLPPGATPFPYHAESMQWELYHVVSGRGRVRHMEGEADVVAGDSFYFAPGDAHTLSNPDSAADFVYLVVADNPIGDACFYPDSNKWGVSLGGKNTILKHEATTYYDGEE